MDVRDLLIEVMLEQAGVGERPFGRRAVGDRHRIGVTIGPGRQPFVIAWEFLCVIVNDAAQGGAGDRINRPAFHARLSAVRPPFRFREHRFMRDDIDDDLAVLGFKGVGGMKNIAGFDRHPDDAVAAALSGKEADARLVCVVPRIGKAVSGQ